MKFFIGLHHPSVSWPFKRVMISINTLQERKKPFYVNDWILDSGGFTQISSRGTFVMSPQEYLDKIEFWNRCGNLVAAVAQDWMCESFILEKTGLSITEHQDRTIESYLYLSERSSVYIMPVLQGFEPSDYVRHLEDYSFLIPEYAWVGVGSVCRRNGNPDSLEDVFLAIKSARPDIKLHGFGLKIQALERPTVRTLLESSDSMAWSRAGQWDGENLNNDPRNALIYAAQVQSIIDTPCFIQDQLFSPLQGMRLKCAAFPRKP
jgi:hypothetical protein